MCMFILPLLFPVLLSPALCFPHPLCSSSTLNHANISYRRCSLMLQLTATSPALPAVCTSPPLSLILSFVLPFLFIFINIWFFFAVILDVRVLDMFIAVGECIKEWYVNPSNLWAVLWVSPYSCLPLLSVSSLVSPSPSLLLSLISLL